MSANSDISEFVFPWFSFLDFYGWAGRTFIPNSYHLPRAIRCCFLNSCIKHSWMLPSIVLLSLYSLNISSHQEPMVVCKAFREPDNVLLQERWHIELCWHVLMLYSEKSDDRSSTICLITDEVASGTCHLAWAAKWNKLIGLAHTGVLWIINISFLPVLC